MTEETFWELHDEEGNVVGIVRDSKLNARSDFEWYHDRSIRREYDGDGNVCFESEVRKHHLRRVWEMDDSVDPYRGDIRYYWRSVRVPWIVWAMFA